MIRPLILFHEAEEEDLGLDADPTKDATPPAEAEEPSGSKGGDDETGADTAAGKDDASPEEKSEGEEELDTEDDEDDEDDLGGDGSEGEAADPVAEQLKRERLYDTVADAQQQCRKLSDAATFIINRSQDETALKFASRAKQLVDEVDEQCNIVMSRFSDLGYERARDLYATIRERVSAVAEIIKHVIDGDDDFRKSDSGAPHRNGSASGYGRGRSE